MKEIECIPREVKTEKYKGSEYGYLYDNTITHRPCGCVLKEETEIKKGNTRTGVAKIKAERVCQHCVSRRAERAAPIQGQG